MQCFVFSRCTHTHFFLWSVSKATLYITSTMLLLLDFDLCTLKAWLLVVHSLNICLRTHRFLNRHGYSVSRRRAAVLQRVCLSPTSTRFCHLLLLINKGKNEVIVDFLSILYILHTLTHPAPSLSHFSVIHFT